MSKLLSIPVKKPPLGDLRRVLAYNIRLLRLEKGWSQEDLALECDLDRTYVSAVERAVWNVSLSNLAKFAQALERKLGSCCGLNKPRFSICEKGSGR